MVESIPILAGTKFLLLFLPPAWTGKQINIEYIEIINRSISNSAPTEKNIFKLQRTSTLGINAILTGKYRMWRDVVRAPCSLEDGLLPNSILHETLHQGLAKLTEEELRCLSGAMSLWGTSLIDRLNISPPNLPLGYLMSQDEQMNESTEWGRTMSQDEQTNDITK